MRFSQYVISFFIADFLEIQRKSFFYLLEKGFITELSKRNPITNPTGELELFFYPEYYQLYPPDWTVKEAILKGKTYACRLYVPAQLINRKTKELKIQWVLLGNLPLMTKRGHFIINGSPRVIVNQMVRSPGIYFHEMMDKKKRRTYYADFICYRGAWLRLETRIHTFKRKKIEFSVKKMWVRMKNKPKVSLVVFLQAMGLDLKTKIVPQFVSENVSNVNPLDLLENSFLKENHPQTTKQALETLYQITHPNVVDDTKAEDLREGGKNFLFRKFFNPRTYDLQKLGRIRLNQKLGISVPLNKTTLTPSDVLFATNYLIKLENGVGQVDDIDHLKNRRVRTSGELIQNQLGIGFLRLEKMIRDQMKIQTPLWINQIGTKHVRQKTYVSQEGHQNESLLTEQGFAKTNFGMERESNKPFLKNTNRPFALPFVEKTGSNFQFQKTKRLTLQTLINTKPVNGILREFFGTNPLSQFMDQTNPLAELTHKRRLSSLGLGGISRDTASMAIRGIHPTHYGRICPIETPEGKNAGLVNSLTIYGRINSQGFLETPFYPVSGGNVQKAKGPLFFSAEQEEKVKAAPGDLKISPLGFLPESQIPVRVGTEFQKISSEGVEYIGVSPLQMISIATSLIPFLEHDDANRALMGSNMQRQAVPLLKPERPIVGTGLEVRVTSDSGHILQAKTSGFVSYVSAQKIVVNSVSPFPSRKFLQNQNKDEHFLKFKPVPTLDSSDGITNLQDPFWWSKITRQKLTFKKTKNLRNVSGLPQLVYSSNKRLSTGKQDISADFLKSEKNLLHSEKEVLIEKGQSVFKTSVQTKGFNFNFLKKNKSFNIFSKKDKKYKTFLIKEGCASKLAKLASQGNKSFCFDPKIFSTPYFSLREKKESTSSQKAGLNLFPAKQLVLQSKMFATPGVRKLNKTEFYKPYKTISTINGLCFERHRTNNQDFLFFNKFFGLNSIEYSLQNYQRSNQDTCLTQRAIVKEGQWVEKGDLLADGAASIGGELALGQNILIAYMPWEGYNFEDAILISNRLVFDDLYTSIHIEKYEVEIRDTKYGVEKITKEIPETDETELQHLDAQGVAKIGSWLKEGDIFVGKVTPKKKKTLLPHEKLLYDILEKEIPLTSDSSLRVPKGVEGRVVDVQIFEKETISNTISSGGPIRVIIYFAEKRKIQVGDKMAGRHGNKGIVSRILPKQDMPYLPDGTPVDMVLNPLGVPSRMNVGQVFECLLGLAGKHLGQQFKVTLFDEIYGPEASRSLVYSKLYSARLKTGQEWLFQPLFPGKTRLFDGRTGESFDQPVTVGQAYMLKLIHLVDEKIHARSTGPYSLVTQQPLRGRSKHGGQRVGEMEVWALEGFGAAYTLQEILTVKSDDMKGRQGVTDAILENNSISLGTPESFRVLIRELQSLCLDVGVYHIDSSGRRKQLDVMKIF